MARVPGIDISKWQGRENPDGSWTATIDWQKVWDSGVRFAYIRAAYGADYVDPLFQDHWDGAKDIGMMRGAYHFCRAHQNLSETIGIMVDTVPGDDRGELPPWYDLERWKNDPVVKGRPLVEFSEGYMLGVESQWGGRLMDVYTGYYFWVENMRVNLRYPNWSHRGLALAQYTTRVPPYPWKTIKGWPHRVLQYSKSGRVPGIGGDVDMDLFEGSYADLLAYANQVVPGQPDDDLVKQVNANRHEVANLRTVVSVLTDLIGGVRHTKE